MNAISPVSRATLPADPMAETMRANATLLEMMIDGEARLERAILRGLVADMREWARRLERA